MQYIITTATSHQWLIESADDESDALRQYYDGDAEPHTAVEQNDDPELAGYLRQMGQAS